MVDASDTGSAGPADPRATDNPIVGHKTFRNKDGSFRHEPLRQDKANALLAAADAADKARAERMPDERSALLALQDAFTRLKELGWREAIYCPKDGTPFQIIEAGSTGIFDAFYSGEWPDGHIISSYEHDSYVSRPGHVILFRPMPQPAASVMPNARDASASTPESSTKAQERGRDG